MQNINQSITMCGDIFLSTNTWQGNTDVSAGVPRVLGVIGVAEVISEDIGIRDKRIGDKSPRMRKDYSFDKDKTLREFLSQSYSESKISNNPESIETTFELAIKERHPHGSKVRFLYSK